MDTNRRVEPMTRSSRKSDKPLYGVAARVATKLGSMTLQVEVKTKRYDYFLEQIETLIKDQFS
jgi:hypothetical protein